MAAEALEGFSLMLDDLAIPSCCESEIEAMLGIAFFTCEVLGFYSPASLSNKIKTVDWHHPPGSGVEDIIRFSYDPNVIYIYPQISLPGCRVDFMCYMRAETIFNEDKHNRFLAIECDGHDFHEKTKAQAIRDKSRDRTLLINGIPSMRFTGSEIWKDPFACVSEVDKFFSGELKKLYAIGDRP